MQLTISPTKRSFLADGHPFFYLADTVWSAFSTTSLEDWRPYLAYRRRQGFTALQISVLPILHDASESGLGLAPFTVDEHGHWDFAAPNAAYFAHAVALVEAARAEGFVPALVLLWCNYVPGTWASKRDPGAIIPAAAIEAYIGHMADLFARFEPIFIVSGDTDFEAPETIEHYDAALRAIKRRCPAALTTLHLAPQADLPGRIAASADLDFYMFQSGHHVEEESRAYTLAERFAGKPVTRPAVNGEPPYEGHGHGHRYARFSAAEVRRASWQSLLSGAGAGITYGAHGVWSWHTAGSAFSSVAFSMVPFDWHEAVRLEGAWDVGFARALFERYALGDLEGRQDLLIDAPQAIRAAATADGSRVAVYVPYATEVTLDLDPAPYRWTVIDLAARRWDSAAVAARAGRAVLGMHAANGDIVAIGERG